MTCSWIMESPFFATNWIDFVRATSLRARLHGGTVESERLVVEGSLDDGVQCFCWASSSNEEWGSKELWCLRIFILLTASHEKGKERIQDRVSGWFHVRGVSKLHSIVYWWREDVPRVIRIGVEDCLWIAIGELVEVFLGKKTRIICIYNPNYDRRIFTSKVLAINEDTTRTADEQSGLTSE